MTADKLRTVGTVILLILITGMLMACNATMVQTKVAVPVICQAVEPVRPVMPTEALTPDATLDSFVQAATAEIERREGFEQNLTAALRSCITPAKAPEL